MPSLNVKSIRTKELQAGECVTGKYAESLVESIFTSEHEKSTANERQQRKTKKFGNCVNSSSLYSLNTQDQCYCFQKIPGSKIGLKSQTSQQWKRSILNFIDAGNVLSPMHEGMPSILQSNRILLTLYYTKKEREPGWSWSYIYPWTNSVS